MLIRPQQCTPFPLSLLPKPSTSTQTHAVQCLMRKQRSTPLPYFPHTRLCQTTKCIHTEQRKSFAGSVFWAAPEVMAGGQHTQSSDLYSFAIIMWEIVARQRLYEGVSQGFLLQRFAKRLPLHNISQLFRKLRPIFCIHKTTVKPSFG